MKHKNIWFVRALSLFLCCFLLVSVVVPAQGTVAEGMTNDRVNEAAAVSGPAGISAFETAERMASIQVGIALGSITHTQELLEHTNEKSEVNAEDDMNLELFGLSTSDAYAASAAYTAASARTAGEITAELMNIAPAVVFDKVIANVNESLNIRADSTTEAEIVGKLYKNSYAEIIERGEEWTKIQSGPVTGYVSNEYLFFDKDALDQAYELEAFQAEVTAGTVNVRTAPSLESEVLKEAKSGDTFSYLPDLSTDEWTAVELEDGTTGYLYSEFTDEDFVLKTAVSKEELEAKKREAEAAKSLEEAKKTKPAKVTRDPITLSDDDIFLMSVVIMMEAGSESYEGQLAVANVLVNRLLSGRWGDTMSDVVYAPGQFSGANSGRIEKFAPKVTESCKRAAVEALAGNNNIGSYMSFIMKSIAKYSSYSEYYVLGGHCFYKR